MLFLSGERSWQLHGFYFFVRPKTDSQSNSISWAFGERSQLLERKVYARDSAINLKYERKGGFADVSGKN